MIRLRLLKSKSKSRGQALSEYALIISLAALAAIITLRQFGNILSQSLTASGQAIFDGSNPFVNDKRPIIGGRDASPSEIPSVMGG